MEPIEKAKIVLNTIRANGVQVGAVLNHMLKEIDDDKLKNNKEELIEFAKEWR